MDKSPNNLIKIVSLALGRTCDNIDLNCDEEPLTWDSLGIIKIMIALEKEFHIKFTIDEALDMVDINHISEIVTKKLAGKQ